MNVHIFFVGVSVRVFAFCPAKKIPRNPLSVSNVRIYICDGALLKNLPLTWERYIYVQKKVIRKAYYLADCCLLYVKYLYLRTGLWSPPRIDFTAFRSDTRPKFFCMMIFFIYSYKNIFQYKNYIFSMEYYYFLSYDSLVYDISCESFNMNNFKHYLIH